MSKLQVKYIDIEGKKSVHLLDGSEKDTFHLNSEEENEALKHHLESYSSIDVIYICDKIILSNLALPKVSKAKRELFTKNDLSDIYGENYGEKFYVYHRDALNADGHGYLSQSFLIPEKDIAEMIALFKSMGVKVNNISPSFLLEESVRNTKAASDQFVITINKNYTSVFFYQNGHIADYLYSSMNLTELSEMETSEKSKVINKFYAKVVGIFGKLSFSFIRNETPSFLLRSSNKELAKEVGNLNPLKIPYVFDDLISRPFDSRAFVKFEKARKKSAFFSFKLGSSMIEVIAAFFIFALVGTTLTTSVLGLVTLNTRTLNQDRATQYLDEVYNRYQANPNDYKFVFNYQEETFQQDKVFVSFDENSGSFKADSDEATYLFKATFTTENTTRFSSLRLTLTGRDKKVYINNQEMKVLKN